MFIININIILISYWYFNNSKLIKSYDVIKYLSPDYYNCYFSIVTIIIN